MIVIKTKARKAAEKIFANGDFTPGTDTETSPGSMIFLDTFDNREKVISELEKALERINAGDYDVIDD